MRLALAAVALVLAVGPAWARSATCIARAHKGAVPYDIPMPGEHARPADTSQGSQASGPDDAEVAGIERDDFGQLWVYRVHEFAWKREDVDLKGDCRRAMAN